LVTDARTKTEDGIPVAADRPQIHLRLKNEISLGLAGEKRMLSFQSSAQPSPTLK
jgi:hypothetical protein